MKAGGTHYELHVGIVTDNNDPEQRGRVKVRCDTLAGAETEWPDYVEPVFPYLGGDGENATAGWFFVPDVGVLVELEIASTSPRDETRAAISLDAPAIRWRACSFAVGGDTISGEFATNYPNRRGIVTGAGHGLVFDDTSDSPEVKLFQTNTDGTTFVDFDQDGSIVMATAAGHMLYMNADADELSILDTNSNALVMSSAGWYFTSPDSDMVKAGGGAVSLMTGNVLINASGVTANVGSFLIAQSPAGALASPALMEGLAPNGFSVKLAASLTEIAAGLAVFGIPTTQTAALIALLSAGAYKATRLSTE